METAVANQDFASRLLKKAKMIRTVNGLGRLNKSNMFDEDDSTDQTDDPVTETDEGNGGELKQGVAKAKNLFEKQFTNQITLKMKFNAATARAQVAEQKILALQEQKSSLEQLLEDTKQSLDCEVERNKDLLNICMSTTGLEPTQQYTSKKTSNAGAASKKSISDRVEKEKIAMMTSNKLDKCKSGIRDTANTVKAFLKEFRKMVTDIGVEISSFGDSIKPIFDQEIRAIQVAYAVVPDMPVTASSKTQRRPVVPQRKGTAATQTTPPQLATIQTQTDEFTPGVNEPVNVAKTEFADTPVPQTPTAVVEVAPQVQSPSPQAMPSMVEPSANITDTTNKLVAEPQQDQVLTKDIIPDLISDLSAIKMASPPPVVPTTTANTAPGQPNHDPPSVEPVIDIIKQLKEVDTEFENAQKELRRVTVCMKSVEPAQTTKIIFTDVLQRMAAFEDRSRVRWEKRCAELIAQRTAQLEKLLVAIQTNCLLSMSESPVRGRIANYVKVISNEIYILQRTRLQPRVQTQAPKPRRMETLRDICGVGIARQLTKSHQPRQNTPLQPQGTRRQRRDVPLRLPTLT
eukprot:TRINITY_DN743_c5_g1_i1.p1 TRINITY_DN743_c5_g1~~TRINITY_DN743_c5_g1_i1.p1  ORF type:complete len:573 (+),score=96.58 TRINITY_DN743_c5_g1_i1:170-1888(+)